MILVLVVAVAALVILMSLVGHEPNYGPAP